MTLPDIIEEICVPMNGALAVMIFNDFSKKYVIQQFFTSFV